MPFLPDYPVVEVYPGVPCPAYATKGRFVIHSSDAHRLEDIQERTFSLDTHPTARDVNAPAQGAGRPPDTPKRHLTR